MNVSYLALYGHVLIELFVHDEVRTTLPCPAIAAMGC